ncbi:MAG: aminopeptidase P family protein, partial [Chloroflexota bacterium]
MRSLEEWIIMEDSGVFGVAQGFLAQEGLHGWLIYDYRGSNPIFRQMLRPTGHVTRPCFLFVPAAGRPHLLLHHVDAGKFANTGVAAVVYQSRETMVESLSRLLSDIPTVAMEYSPQNVLPRVSKVDAGTVELVRGLGVEVVSSADLM